MTATQSASVDATIAFSEQDQAAALWTYVHLKIPRFTTDAALEVVRRLAPRTDEDPKALAKRLRKELELRGVALKNTTALDAAARLLGHNSWHAANRLPQKAKLKLTSIGESGEEFFSKWRDVIPRLCASCDAWLQRRETRIFQVRFGPTYMMLSVPVHVENGSAGRVESFPLLTINPVAEDATWLEEAPAALESLRRHLEEPGKAVLDGIAVLQLCGASRGSSRATLPQSVRPNDVCNSELILERADNELGQGYEIARGDEMTCWSQLELASKDHEDTSISMDDAAWRIGAGRYVWQLSTLHPNDFIPGLVIRELGEEDSAKLYRRYKLAKRLYKGRLSHHEQTKQLEYLGTLSDYYRVDVHTLLLEMSKVGLTWETYCAEIGEQVPMVPKLSVGFVFALLERLKLSDPNVVFSRPNRSELSRVDDDSLLRALLPRVDHVMYRLPSGATADLKETVRDAIEEFSTSMRLQKMQAAGSLVDPKDPFPYLVYAGDGEELRLKLANNDLVMYAGVMPHLFSTKGLIDQPPNSWPFAIGSSLFLDIEFAERAAR